MSPLWNTLANLSEIRLDIADLGAWSLVRGGYEIAKRTGVLAQLHRTERHEPPGFRSPLPIPTERPGLESRARVLHEAARIANGNIRVFARSIEFDGVPDWHAVIDVPGRWPQKPWWQIDLRSQSRVGDIKWAWELGRHRHLVVLARAAWLEPNQHRWVETIERHLRSWLDENPPETGVHWASNLELSLRTAAWLQVLTLAGDHLSTDVVSRMAGSLWHTGSHLLVELPYTLSTMRNNHLLGDAVGLLLLGRTFDGPRARRWERIGRRLLLSQGHRELYPDGSTIEDSLSYQRFVLELLTLAVLCGPHDDPTAATVRGWLGSGGGFLTRLGVMDGPVPKYGDWDEGRALVSGQEPGDLTGSTLLALALSKSSPPLPRTVDAHETVSDGVREDYDELVWYGPPGVPALPGASAGAQHVSRGIAYDRRGPLRLWLRCTTVEHHGHADLGSVEIALGEDWLVGDPGTGTYNADAEVRDGFRSTRSHSSLRLAGQDQLGPRRVFRWHHRGRGSVGATITIDGTTILWGTHDSYLRLNPPRRVVRAVLIDDVRAEASLTVIDWVEGPPGVAWALDLPLGPRTTWTPDPDVEPTTSGLLTTPSGVRHLRLPCIPVVAHGSRDPWRGWWSSTYGALEPSTALVLSGELTGSVVWHLSPPESAPIWRREGELIVRDRGEEPVTVGVEWRDTVALVVRKGESEWRTCEAEV